jgi:hypothetical protein
VVKRLELGVAAFEHQVSLQVVRERRPGVEPQRSPASPGVSDASALQGQLKTRAKPGFAGRERRVGPAGPAENKSEARLRRT